MTQTQITTAAALDLVVKAEAARTDFQDDGLRASATWYAERIEMLVDAITDADGGMVELNGDVADLAQVLVS